MKIRRLFTVLFFLTVFSQAHAGSACTETAPDARNVMRALELAQKSSKALDDSGAKVAMIARVGQDLSQYHLLASGDMRKFHGRPYNMVAYPFSTEFQNSNQWLLETLSSAMAQDTVIASRSDAQAWLKLAGYRPTTLNVPMMQRLGADFFRANISFNDHPLGERMAGRIDTVTVESVVDFVARRDSTLRRIELAVN